MGTLNAYYTAAAAVPPPDRRWVVGAGYKLDEYVRMGYPVATARSAILSLPSYANALNTAGLTATYNAIDSFPSGGGGGGGSTNYPGVVTPDSPISYWRLPATTDSAGSSPLTFTGSPATGASLITAGSGGNSSLVLDGVDDQASAADTAALNPATIAVEAWINVSATIGSFGTFVAKTTSSSWNDGWGLMWVSGVLRWWVNSYNVQNAGAANHIDFTPSFGQAYHIVGIKTASQIQMFANGTEVPGSPVALTAAIASSAGPLLMGNDGAGDLGKGFIDEVAIYSSLSAARISAHYAAGIS